MNSQPPLTFPQANQTSMTNSALAIGAYLCAADYLLSRSFKLEPTIREFLGIQPGAFSYCLVAFCMALKIVGLWRFGSSRLVADIREICFYDLLAVFLGLGLYLAGEQVMPAKVLNYGFLFVLVARLCWHFKTTSGTELATWPVFGLLGLFSKLFAKLRSKQPQPRPAVPGWHDHVAYALILISPVFGLGLVKLNSEQVGAMVAALAIVFIFLQAPMYMGRKAPVTPPPDVKPREVIDPALPEPDFQSLSPDEKALLLAFRQMPDKNKPQLLSAVLALRKVFGKAAQADKLPK
jgi:hypothetical protein